MSAKEIVFISGKGGTGKTTFTSALISSLKNIIVADCDVDAPDLHILLNPELKEKEDFIATQKAVIDKSKCTNCGKCKEVCRFNAIDNPIFCEGCGTCELVCPADAISLKPYKTGEIFKSTTKYGEMIHARLTPGEEVSGRLVSEVRKRAKIESDRLNTDYIVIDGPPGIACNVISAVTGCDLAIIVTEPTLSGFHDLKRVYKTVTDLKVNAAVIINKYDLSPEISMEIESYCSNNNIQVLLKQPLSNLVIESINKKKIPDIVIPTNLV